MSCTTETGRFAGAAHSASTTAHSSTGRTSSGVTGVTGGWGTDSAGGGTRLGNCQGLARHRLSSALRGAFFAANPSASGPRVGGNGNVLGTTRSTSPSAAGRGPSRAALFARVSGADNTGRLRAGAGSPRAPMPASASALASIVTACPTSCPSGFGGSLTANRLRQLAREGVCALQAAEGRDTARAQVLWGSAPRATRGRRSARKIS